MAPFDLRKRGVRRNREQPFGPGVLFGGFVFAMLPRLWSLGFGLPGLIHEDEPKNWNVAADMVHSGTFNPHFFNYPSLMFYFIALWQKFILAIGAVDRLLPLGTPIAGVARTEQSGAFLGARVLSVFVGVALCFAVSAAAWMITNRRRSAVLAFAVMAVAPIAVRHSRFVAPDIYAALFFMLTVVAALRLLRRQQRIDYVLAGVAVGLAIGSKYTMVVAFVVVVAAHCMVDWATAIRRVRSLVTAGVVAVVVFFVSTPYALLSPSEFLDDVRYEVRHYANGHPGFEGNAPVFYLQRLANDWWWLALIACAVGVIGLWKTNRKAGVVMVSAVLPYYLYIASQTVRFERNILAIVGPLAVFAAVGVERVWIAAFESRTRARSRHLRITAVVVIMITGLVPAASTIVEARSITHNPWLLPQRYIDSQLPRTSRIFAETYTPWIDAQHFAKVTYGKIADYEPEWFVKNRFDYVIASSGAYARFFANEKKYATRVEGYRAVFTAFCDARRFTDGDLTIRILATDRQNCVR